MKWSHILLAVFAFALAAHAEPPRERFRPPAVPLVAVDPYFSIWSFADHLNYEAARHWTGARMTMQSFIRVDGKTFRVMGDEPRTMAPARQLSLRVLPTRTVYEFRAAGVLVRLTFLTPDLPKQIEILSRPVTYLTWNVRSADGKPHRVQIYFDNTAELVVNAPDELVNWKAEKLGTLDALRMGTAAQPILKRAGDFVRIDWGYLYAAAPGSENPEDGVMLQRNAEHEFAMQGDVNATSEMSMPRAASDGWPVMAFAFRLGTVGTQVVSRHIILAYDEIYPVEYFGKRLRPFWERNNATFDELIEHAERDYDSLHAASRRFDKQLMADLTSVGGARYADVAALAYRQAFAANTLALSPAGKPLMFLKEISSCGCAQTADVIYPESPIFLLLNPDLLEDSLVPLLDYAQSKRWPYPYAPHDLGTYPLDNGRNPAQMESMPVEETGNMLLMIAAIAKAKDDAQFASDYWPLLTKWANYLKQNGLDPGNQLCTDDFTGLLSHNANLSLKAIEALGAYAMLAKMLGEMSLATDFRQTAQDYASKWMKVAAGHGGTRLSFDRPGTWSQKYNLIWDRVLGLNLFPATLAEDEVKNYRSSSTQFGFPLDSRSAFTKLDWESWSAALASSRSEFQELFAGVYNFAQHTPDRVPLSDWYWTVDGTKTGFQARPVVGGVFMEMLTNREIWKKWARAKSSSR